jgi:predicted ABC-type ATPase
MPILYVIAGPNGIGKTTSSYDLVPANISIINSDEISKEIRNVQQSTVNLQEYANHEAVRLMEEQREQRNSFAIETNLADVDTWKFLLKVQQTGYQLHILYLSTGNLETLNNRIRKRTLLGDHFVRPEIVEERYVNSLKLLDHYFEKADKLQLFDNSQNPQLIGEISYGQIIFQEKSLPDWVTTYLGKHFLPQLKEEKSIKDMTVDEIRINYQNRKGGN